MKNLGEVQDIGQTALSAGQGEKPGTLPFPGPGNTGTYG